MDGAPVGVIQAEIHVEGGEGLGNVEGVQTIRTIVVTVFLGQAVQRLLQLLSGKELGDLRGDVCDPVGNGAGIADKALGTALIKVGHILPDGEGMQLAAFEDGLVEALIHAEEVMLKVKDDLRVKGAEIDFLGNLENLLQLLVFLPESPVGKELIHAHIVSAAGNVNDAVAVVADILSVDLPRKQPFDFPSADGAGILFCKQTHIFPPIFVVAANSNGSGQGRGRNPIRYPGMRHSGRRSA